MEIEQLVDVDITFMNRFYNEKKMADVVFYVEGKQFYTMKAVLAMRSSFFRDFFLNFTNVFGSPQKENSVRIAKFSKDFIEITLADHKLDHVRQVQEETGRCYQCDRINMPIELKCMCREEHNFCSDFCFTEHQCDISHMSIDFVPLQVLVNNCTALEFDSYLRMCYGYQPEETDMLTCMSVYDLAVQFRDNQICESLEKFMLERFLNLDTAFQFFQFIHQYLLELTAENIEDIVYSYIISNLECISLQPIEGSEVSLLSIESCIILINSICKEIRPDNKKVICQHLFKWITCLKDQISWHEERRKFLFLCMHGIDLENLDVQILILLSNEEVLPHKQINNAIMKVAYQSLKVTLDYF